MTESEFEKICRQMIEKLTAVEEYVFRKSVSLDVPNSVLVEVRQTTGHGYINPTLRRSALQKAMRKINPYVMQEA